MKKTSIIYFLLIATVLFCVNSCKEEGTDLRPGLYVDTDLIDAFPGKEITIYGQASCYTGFDSVSITCEAWNIRQVDNLGGQRPVVWNFSYSFTVPQDAKFPQEVIITATDVHGTQMKKAIAVRYTPATTPPFVGGLQKQIAIDYDEAAGTGECSLKATLYAEDYLKWAIIEIPDESVRDSFPLTQREEEILITHTFAAKGSYPMTITVADNSGNIVISEHKLIVMKPEKTDEVKDYPYMWAFTAGEDEGAYVFGFYQYLDRQDSYQYQVYVYAPSDETAFFFTPTQETNGERLFGESPYVEDRIISMQSEPGYVKGYKPGKGYWGFWIDINEKTIRKWSLNTADADKSQLYHTGDWNGWTFEPMGAGDSGYQQKADITLHAGNQYFGFSPATDWTKMWRIWKKDGMIAGWWFSEDGAGDGAPLPSISSDVEATIIFDTAIPWCWIIKK